MAKIGRPSISPEEVQKRMAETKPCAREGCSNFMKVWSSYRDTRSPAALNWRYTGPYCSRHCGGIVGGKRLTKEDTKKRLTEIKLCEGCHKPMKIWKQC